MSAQRATAEVVAELVELTSKRGPVEPTRIGLEAALHGRAAALDLAYRMVADIGGITGGSKDRSMYELLRARPSSALANTLAHRSQPPLTKSPTDVVVASAPGSLSLRWEKLGATATAALVHWNGAVERPRDEAALSALVDAATITMHCARLDTRMRQLAFRLGAMDIGQSLVPNTTGKMQFSAGNLLHAIRDVDRGQWDARALPRAESLPVISITNGRLLPAALTRLTDQIRTTQGLGPHEATLLVGAQARMATLLADQAQAGFRANGDDRLRHLSEALSEHARRLAIVPRHTDDKLHGLLPVDPRLLQQASECQRFMAGVRQAGWPAASQLASLITDLAPALSGAVDRAVHRGQWAVLWPMERDNTNARPWSVTGPSVRPPIADRLAKIPRPSLDPTAPATAPTLGVGRHRARIHI